MVLFITKLCIPEQLLELMAGESNYVIILHITVYSFAEFLSVLRIYC